MLEESLRRSLSSGEGMGLFRDRSPQTTHAGLPPGTVLVSADNHFPIVDDIFYDRFPAHLREKAPRIWWDEEAQVHQIGFNHVPLLSDNAVALIRSMEDAPGARDFDARMRDLDAEAISQEIAFPQLVSMFFGLPDLEVRAAVFRAYNEYVAEMQTRRPDRFFPVGIVDYFHPDKAAASVRALHELGLKAFLLPVQPGTRSDGRPVIWSDDEYRDMWSAAQETGAVVTFHIGEGFKSEGLNGDGPRLLFQTGSSQFRKVFGVFVFGLIFDNFPELKVVFAEGGINWVAGLLQDAEMLCNHHVDLFESRPKHRPSHYWHRNCYATFQDDPVGLRMLDVIGADRIMWAVDYPHNESVFGYTHDVIGKIVTAVGSDDDVRNILGGTAKKVFGI